VSYDEFCKTDPNLEIFASAPYVPQIAVTTVPYFVVVELDSVSVGSVLKFYVENGKKHTPGCEFDHPVGWSMLDEGSA
jgi:hypothetical protein